MQHERACLIARYAPTLKIEQNSRCPPWILGGAGFQKESSPSGPQPTKVLSYWTETKRDIRDVLMYRFNTICPHNTYRCNTIMPSQICFTGHNDVEKPMCRV
jgi:hypothetical protein